MNLLISPHDDDSHLFSCYTLLRQKPLVVVVTDSFIQPNRGEVGCSAEARAEETRKACEVTGNGVVRLGIRDDQVTEAALRQSFKQFSNFEKIYAPAIQGGNAAHDLVGEVAQEVFGEKVIQYTTYTKTELWTPGKIEIIPSSEEKEIKAKALNCYQSQLYLPATRPHFIAVWGKSEWLN